MNKMAKMMLMNGQNRREDRNWDYHRDQRDRRREGSIMYYDGQNGGQNYAGNPTGDWNFSRQNYGRGDYGNDYGGYGSDSAPEDRFRDRRGREHYDNGRYAPQNYFSGDARYNGERPMGSWYPHKMPNPYYPDPRFSPYSGGGQNYEREAQPMKMNKIGFSTDTGMDRYPEEFPRDRRSGMEYSQREEIQHRRGEYMAGYGSGEAVRSINKESAEEWASHMENEDGTTGPHWTMEQTKQVQSQKGIDCDPVQFWIVMNMMYSDYSRVAKKMNISSSEFYACMAEAFLDDKDAQPDKLARYYQFVVKH